MTWKLLPFLLLPAAVLAQPTLDGETARIFRFAHAQSPQQIQEIVNAVRSVAEVQRAVADDRAGAIVVRGTPEQIDLVAWLVAQLDRAPAEAQATRIESHQAKFDYAPQARVFFLAHATSPQAMQELVNTVRSVAEVQRAVFYNGTPALVIRGTAEQADLAAWIVRNLDKPAGAGDGTALEYTYNDTSPRPATAVRMFRLAHATSPQAVQELINAVRSIAEIQRVSPNTPTATITMRSTPAQAAMATWLVQELDRAPGAPK